MNQPSEKPHPQSHPSKIPSLSKLDKFRNATIGLLLWVGVLIPLGLIALTPFFLLHVGVHLLARLFRHDLIPLEKKTLWWWFWCPCPSRHSSSSPTLTWYLPCATYSSQVWKVVGRQKLQAVELRDHFSQTFLSTQELREKYENLSCVLEIWLGYCFKRRLETFLLEKRIKELSLSEEELAKDFGGADAFIGNWMRKYEEFETTAPHWDILLLHTYNHPSHVHQQTYLLFKIDLRLCDSGGLVHLMEKLTGVKSPKVLVSPSPSVDVKPPGNYSSKIWDKLGFPTAFLGYTWSLMRTRNLPLPKGRDLTKRKSSADEGKEAKKPTAQWIFSTSTLSLEEVKKVKRVSLSRFLNILASVEVSALRRFLLERGSRLDSELPHNLWVSHLHEESHEELRNSVSLGLFKIPFRKDVEGVVRLRDGDKGQDYCEEIRFNEMISWIVFPIVKVIPSKLFHALYRSLWKIRDMGMSHMLNPLVLSNNEPYYLLGRKVSHVYLFFFTEDTKPFRFFVSPTSNQGQVDVAVSATTDLFPTQNDLDIFTKVYLEEELRKLVASVEMEV